MRQALIYAQLAAVLSCRAPSLGNPTPVGGNSAGPPQFGAGGGGGGGGGGSVGGGGVPTGLSTQNGNIVSAAGQVVLHGITWFGFENGSGLLQGLNQGTNNIAGDFATQIYRLQALGFNTVRLPFSFSDLANLTPQPTAQTCTMQSTTALKAALSDPDVSIPGNANFPAMVYPQLPTPIQCNEYLPHDTMYHRFAFIIDFIALNNMYVVLTNHVANDSTYQNPNAWLASWVTLVDNVTTNPNTREHIIFDPVDEPDSVGLTWDGNSNAPINSGGMVSLYNLELGAMDTISAINPNTLFFVQGTGQANIGAYPGDGFATNQSVIDANQLSSPVKFFTTLYGKSYVNRVVLTPHVAPPSISGNPNAGMTLWGRLNTSFGYYNRAGLTLGTTTHTFPVLIVMGSQLTAMDTGMMNDLASYMLSTNNAADSIHNNITSWIWQAWNGNSSGTGGLQATDWQDIVWSKIDYLAGLTANFANNLGLVPWWEKS